MSQPPKVVETHKSKRNEYTKIKSTKNRIRRESIKRQTLNVKLNK